MQVSSADRLVLLTVLLCALQPAGSPWLLAQEIGTNDFRISFNGGTGNPASDAESPAVAYNPDRGEYLVVWSGDSPMGFEIRGQRIAASGERLGADFQVDAIHLFVSLDSREPDVVYNPTDREYLVVWSAEDENLAAGEFEIYARRLAADGTRLGGDLRISDMGSTHSDLQDARRPAVAYNLMNNEYLVVWQGDDSTGGLVDNEFEIFGQRLDGATGAELGVDDFRISDMGGSGDSAYDASASAIAYNVLDNEYLVVWQGDDAVDGELEIYGQRLNAATGTALGANDFRISDVGDPGDAAYDAAVPAVAYNVLAHEYLVVWYGDDNVGGLVDNEFEIFGQRLDAATGAELGANDFRISSMGGTGDEDYDGAAPAIAHNVLDDAYLVAWYGGDDVGGLAPDEFEIFAQYVSREGANLSPNDFRISDMGGTGDNPFDASVPAVSCGTSCRELLVVWEGNDDVDGLAIDEYEIFGQRLVGSIGVVVEDLDCQLFASTDLPKPIPEGIHTSGLTSATLVVGAAAGGIVGDLDVADLYGSHTRLHDLEFFLESPSGDLIQLLERSCEDEQVDDFDLRLDDQAPPGSPPCPPDDGAAYRPFEGLATFFGEESAGTWTLVILDQAEGGSGELVGWSLEICTAREETIFSDGFESGSASAWGLAPW